MMSTAPAIPMPRGDGNAPFGELARHQLGGAHRLEAQLRMSADVAAHRSDAGDLRHDGVDDFHQVFLYQGGKTETLLSPQRAGSGEGQDAGSGRQRQSRVNR